MKKQLKSQLKKTEKVQESFFDPNGVADKRASFFGLSSQDIPGAVSLISAPWDVTTSYGDGTVNGPEAIKKASYQVDFQNPLLDQPWTYPLFENPFPKKWKQKNHLLRQEAKKIISSFESGKEIKKLRKKLDEVNSACRLFHNEIKQTALRAFDRHQKPLLIGGDHSTSQGVLEALSEKFSEFSILHIDAHADLRQAYEGFEYSHASIMYNALKLKGLKKIIQVGIRDYSEEEEKIFIHSPQVSTFLDWDLKKKQFEGQTWKSLCERIVSELEGPVYISFDIDGLDPKLCPATGTPVPGGLEFFEVVYLFEKVLESGTKILGADLVEVSPDPSEWNANVGARILFNLFCVLQKSGPLS